MKEINYSEIDELCRPVVKFFNDINLRTKFSCQGHDNNYDNNFYIMFHEEVTDEQIYNFISKYLNKYNHSALFGKFVKWARVISGKVVTNWIYMVDLGNNYKLNQLYAQKDFKIFQNL